MPSDKNSISNTLIVAISLCLVCASVVSVAAVGLRSLQQANKLRDRKANILAAAGLMEDGGDVEELFATRIVDRIIDLDSGEDVTDEYPDPAAFDPIELAESNDATASEALQDDPATIKRRENRAHVYVVKTSADDPAPLMYVFPIRGKGLWSILKGFLALDADLQTIRGITYYEHAETPGLGGEVDNPEWKSHWRGKRLFDDSGKVAIQLVKSEWEGTPSRIDALSGATITCRGVERMLDFWMGESGFGPFLDRLQPASSAASQVSLPDPARLPHPTKSGANHG
jgi:Na+-transporting NADH:ubiquinone oxidoreductase subunit C